MPLLHETLTHLPAPDGHAIALTTWAGETPPRALVLISHGMGEHVGRYRRFARSLVEAGCLVAAHDHRGHGASAQAAGTLGDYGPGGFAALVDDLRVVADALRARHPGLPLVLFGHSMGSFAAQCFVLRHADRLSGLILSGTAALDLMFAGRAKQSRLEDLNAGVDHPRTPFDWLSRDPAEVDAYLADPLCGFSITPESRATLVAACAATWAPDAFSALPKSLPVHLVTGDHDPVNGHLAWFHPLVQRLREAGLVDVTARVWEGARHEVLNETNRDEVTADLVAQVRRMARL